MFSSRKTAAPSTGYNLTKSLRFRTNANANLTRTFSTPTSATTWTMSAWVKRSGLGVYAGGTSYAIFGSNTSGNNIIGFNGTDNFTIQTNGAASVYLITTQVFRDPSSWYHIVVQYDTTQATSSNRCRLYINGSQVTAFTTATYPTLNSTVGQINTAVGHAVGSYAPAGGWYWDGYMTEFNFVDGQSLTPSSFGSTNALTGVWQPAKYTGTYGTNGFYLPFTNTTSTTTLGYDFSGNSNNWTTNNLSLTAGTTYDSMTDVPTLTSATTANYCVFNPLNCNSNITLSNGNLSATSSTNGANTVIATMPIPSTGKAYWEYKITAVASSLRINLGAASTTSSITPTVNPSNLANAFALNWQSGFSVTVNGAYTYGPTGSTNLSVNDVVMIAYDATTGNLWGGLNGTWYNSGNPAAGTGSITTMTAGLNWLPYAYLNTSGGANATDVNFGQQPFAYTQPTGFNSINAYNLPTSTIVKGNTVMDATLWTGTNATLGIVNSGAMKPDFMWIKRRSAVASHVLIDTVRGLPYPMFSDSTGSEQTATAGTGITAVNSNGFTLGTDISTTGATNTNAQTFVGWQWQAGQGTTSSNTSGTITSTTCVNATAGFSIVSWTQGSSTSQTIGHGLGVAPAMFIVKDRTATSSWYVYHQSIGATGGLNLNSTSATTTTANFWNNTAPTSSVMTISTNCLGTSGDALITYCWTPIAGYSAFGSYTGNGSADGTFVYTGFRPKFVMIKRTDGVSDWTMFDSSRIGYNPSNNELYANLTHIEDSNVDIDLVSNGFKLRTTDGYVNASGGTFIYAAFAENPFKYANAR